VVQTYGQLALKVLFFLWVLVGIMLLFLPTGCDPAVMQPAKSAATQSADLVMRLTNAEVMKLNEIETAEGDACIWDQPTIPEAEKCLVGVREKWRGIWKAVRLFDETHDVVADTLENGGVPELASLRNAYCAMLQVLPADSGFPDWPINSCTKAVTP
jgi:hypothetical protein